VPGTVTHTFTHFKLELVVYRALVSTDATLTFWAEPERCRWVKRRELYLFRRPSVMRKVVAHALREH
jgi:A/G-specific adenine glycosylase